MNSNIYGKNSESFRNKKEELNSILKLSGSRILSNSLDKKKYKNSPQKVIEIYNDLKKSQNNQLLTLSNEALPSYKKLPIIKRNKANINRLDNQYKSNQNLFINNKNYYSNWNINQYNSYLKTDDNDSNLNKIKENNKKEKFVFLHEIKKIKKKVDLLHKDKSIKTIMNNEVAFDEKNSKIALNPIKIINNFQNLKSNEVMNQNNNLFSFLTEKAKISRKNVLIKLLSEQKEDFDKTINAQQKKLTEMKKNIDTDENDFYTLVQTQKVSSRKIEELLDQLLIRKRDLLIEQYYLQYDIRTRQDERQKLLEHINEYRIIAKFLTKALGGRGKLFDFRLTTLESNTSDNEYTYEKETQKILQRFGFLLNYNPKASHINQDDIDIFNEITSLNYSDVLFHQLWKKEDSILNNLKRNNILNKEILYFQENEENKISYLKDKIEILEKELKYNEDILELEKKDYDKIYRKKFEKNADFEEIITDFYNFVFNKDKKNTKNKNKRNNTSIVDVEDCISALQKAIIDKEELMNKVKSDLEKCENEDKILFDRVVNDVKRINKEIHVINMKRLNDAEEHNKLKLLKIPKEKIILKYKKSEPPYYLIKKEKKVKIAPEITEQLENEELLTYD